MLKLCTQSSFPDLLGRTCCSLGSWFPFHNLSVFWNALCLLCHTNIAPRSHFCGVLGGGNAVCQDIVHGHCEDCVVRLESVVILNPTSGPHPCSPSSPCLQLCMCASMQYVGCAPFEHGGCFGSNHCTSASASVLNDGSACVQNRLLEK